VLAEAEIDKIKSVVSDKSEIAYVYLFGSARQRLLSHSDIDLMIGGELSPDERADLSMRLSLKLGRQIDLVFSGEARSEVLLRALSSGIPILVRDRERLKDDYFKNFHLYDQATPLKRIRLERLKKVYRNG